MGSFYEDSLAIANSYKQCRRCEQYKPLSEFSISPGGRIGSRASRCKPCERIWTEKAEKSFGGTKFLENKFKGFNSAAEGRVGVCRVMLTFDEFSDLMTRSNDRCEYCGSLCVILSGDHFIPLSKGGSHKYDNLVAACHSCNSLKSARPAKYLQWLLDANWFNKYPELREYSIFSGQPMLSFEPDPTDYSLSLEELRYGSDQAYADNVQVPN